MEIQSQICKGCASDICIFVTGVPVICKFVKGVVVIYVNL